LGKLNLSKNLKKIDWEGFVFEKRGNQAKIGEIQAQTQLVSAQTQPGQRKPSLASPQPALASAKPALSKRTISVVRRKTGLAAQNKLGQTAFAGGARSSLVSGARLLA
jgi:hypothetical protein